MKERINTNPHILQFIFKRNKFFPNSKLPVLIYQQALSLPAQKKKAAGIIQRIFNRNGWSNAWTNGIYDFHHYHSITHECMAVATGNATVILGGPSGKKIRISQGDIILLPAGVGHKCIKHSEDFQCVGAYPQGKDYDINTGTEEEYGKAIKNIRKVSLPRTDPLAGKYGFLKTFWK